MECSEPGAIQDEELIGYLVGVEVRPAVVEHLAHCLHCSAQLAAYRRIERLLVGKLYRWDCPTSQLLGEYHLGLLDEQRVTEIKDHLSVCVLCVADVATLATLLESEPLFATTGQVVTEITPRHRPSEEGKHTLGQWLDQSRMDVRRIIASLLPAQPRLAYQRGTTSPLDQWPRQYIAEDVNISIQVERSLKSHSALQLIGFVTRQGLPLEALQGIPVRLVSEGNAPYTQDIDELGNFIFLSVAPALYTLELQFPNSTIVIDQLPIDLQD